MTGMIGWTRLPFEARTMDEFDQKLPEWMGQVFYDVLPELGFEVREEQIYTAFRMAKALTQGTTLMAEAGPGTGKTFAYLLPAVCFARFKGSPVLIASASNVLQRQLASPEGDVQTLSRLLGLKIDARLAADPGEYICEVKVRHLDLTMHGAEMGELRRWAETTGTGARTEVPHVADELWQHLAWDPALPCDTCPLRGHCHVMSARRHYREAPDLLICDHRLFSLDLLTRTERQESGLVPLLPAYSAVVFDEGHHVAETWQRAQGHQFSREKFVETVHRLEGFVDRVSAVRAVRGVKAAAVQFFKGLAESTESGEGKRRVERGLALLDAATRLNSAVEALQDELVTEEAMNEGLEISVDLQAFQVRFDEVCAALGRLQSEKSISWVEGDDLWVVPRHPKGLFGEEHLKPSTPVIFSSATLEPAYQARVLQIPRFESSTVGVPFDLGEQMLIFQLDRDGIGMLDVVHAARGRSLILLNSLEEVRILQREWQGRDLPWRVIWEGEGDRGAQLAQFREEVSSVLVGATLWEGVDVPGEALSCCIIPRLPFPRHDPLIAERREQATRHGFDPLEAVDLPEMLMKLKQGAGRLIRTAEDRGVLALLDRSLIGKPWADRVDSTLPEDAERTTDLDKVRAFLASS